MMKKILFYSLIFLGTLFASIKCPDFSVNSKACLRDTTNSYPIYSNGEEMNVGEAVCRTLKENTLVELTTKTKQGIEVALSVFEQVCRVIDSIQIIQIPQTTKAERIDKECCYNMYVRDFEQFGAKEKEKHINGSLYQGCIHNYRGSYNSCKYNVDSTYFIPKYETVYGDSSYIVPNFNKGIIYTIKQTESAFLEGDTIELYRKNGTLRYRGFVNIIDSLVITKGQCYNAQGTRPSRKTNNADLCK